jgi:hypothetical protein
MNRLNICRVGLLPLLLATGGCSDMDPAEDTYRIVYLRGGGAGGDDGAAGGSSGSSGSSGSGGSGSAPIPPQWACLMTPSPPYEPPDPPPSTISYILPVADFDNQMPLPAFEVKLCQGSACAPDIPIPPPVRADPVLPIYLLQIPFGLRDAYLQVSADGYATMDYYFGGPMIGSPRTPFVANALPMLKQETLDRLLVDVQAPSPSPTGRGVLAIRTLDCMGGRAPNVDVEPTIEMPPDDIVPWTLSDNNIAAPGATTDGRGVAGFANVPEGAFRVQGIAPAGDGIEYGAHTLRVRAGQITLGEVRVGIGQIGQ